MEDHRNNNLINGDEGRELAEEGGSSRIIE